MRLHATLRHVHGSLFLLVSQVVEDGVGVHGLLLCAFRHFHGIAARGFSHGEIAQLSRFVVFASDAVVGEGKRVAVVYELLQALCLRVAREQGSVGHVEVAVVVEQQLFGDEGLSLVGHARRSAELLRLHILEPLTAPQAQEQVLLVGGGLQHSRVGEDDLLVFPAGRASVDHDAVELARFHVFLLHVDVAARDSAVENALGNLHFRTFLLHRDEQLLHVQPGVRADVVLEIERAEAREHGHHDERPHGLHERDAGGLDGGELAALAKVSESDERGQQQRQR